ncbi:MAG: hypothetical protein OHK0022_46680 [Roseiflexaceae bacterium]
MTTRRVSKIFDNIDQRLIDALLLTLKQAQRADFCVGFFNLRGWGLVADAIDHFTGDTEDVCRVLIGMNESPDRELRRALRVLKRDTEQLDLARAAQIKARVAEDFRRQLIGGAPNNADETALRALARQIQEGKVQVRLHLRYNLHAKLYLAFRSDPDNPVTSYLGSSNLTMAGLRVQGELNTKITDALDNERLAEWFTERWEDEWSFDVSDDIVKALEESWAGTERRPYHIYLKMAYHLSEEARAGLNEYTLPADFRGKLFPFQEAAVKIAARHLNERGGVLLGDVVGLGKTMMASALIRIFRDDFNLRPLVICPKNLVEMWRSYNLEWDLGAEIIPISQVQQRLPGLVRRFKLVVIDESHTLRNREGKRYRAITDYVRDFGDKECKVVLLSATPYNASYLDMSAQLRLFVPEDRDLGVRPEVYLRNGGEDELLRAQIPPRTLRAFEYSPHPDDWRELMRLFMVRRTRSFIKQHYAHTDPADGRSYIELAEGRRFYFPTRVPKTLSIGSDQPGDPYRLLYDSSVVDLIDALRLPRYGLAFYLKSNAERLATPEERAQLQNLTRAGRRLLGFCRTNLFKRLESGGAVFLQSIERHVLRNCIVLYAIEQQLPIPLGAQDAQVLDAESDLDLETAALLADEEGVLDEGEEEIAASGLDDSSGVAAGLRASRWTAKSFQQRAAQLYRSYAGPLKRRFRWLRPELFTPKLRTNLQADVDALLQLLQTHGDWDPSQDGKLQQLIALLHELGEQKVLIFSQFADSVTYLAAQLQHAGLLGVAGVTGQSSNPTELARRFSPVSNGVTEPALLDNPIRVLIATDVLSEGQNLQDAHIVVNYDLPWAIIRLIQRAGRVDRIGQLSSAITCYTFLPADGIEQIIRLRARVRQRLTENSEVVGADDQFFEEADPDQARRLLTDLYTERQGALDEEETQEVDLASYAYQIWRNATAANPSLKKQIEDMPNVVYSTRLLDDPTAPISGLPFQAPPGVLVYLKTAAGTDALSWIAEDGTPVTQSQYAILRAAECTLDTKPVPRDERHHELVESALALVEEREARGGALGSVRGARYRLYQQLTFYREDLLHTAPLLLSDELQRTIDDIYRYPLRQSAIDAVNRQIRSGVSREQLANLAITLRAENRLSLIQEQGDEDAEPQIVCSLGLV